MFNHCPPISLTEYKRVQINGKRHYQVPNGNYPSITSVLSFQDNSWLDDWRAKVGAEEADKISARSKGRGTNLHKMCEDYLNNDPQSCKMPDAKEMFISLKPILNKINNIHFQEACLYSDKLKVAGTVDCIAEYDGVLSIIDFKNSRYPKTLDKINDYLLQETFYSLAYYELSGLYAPQIVTIIAVENNVPQVFIEQIHPYMKPLVSLVKEFHSTFYKTA